MVPPPTNDLPGSRKRAFPSAEGRPTAWSYAVLFAVYFGYVLSLSAPHLTGGDCGEYVAAGAYLGNVHPPGNPVHHQLSYLLQLAPFGDAYQRSAALSALAAAGAVTATAVLLAELGCSIVVGFGLALLYGFSPALLRNAVVTEVYTLLILYLALFSLAFLRLVPDPPTRMPDGRRSLLLPFLAGFGMGIHYLSLFFTFPMVWSAWRRSGGGRKELAAGILLFLAGFSVMLYLPARALAVPPVNFGAPSTPDAFFRSIFRLMYLSRPADQRTAELFLRQVAWLSESLLVSVSACIPALAAVGLLGVRNNPRHRVFLASGILFLGGNLLLQNFPSRILNLSEMPRFVGPALLPFHLLAGIGLETILRRLSQGGPVGPDRVRNAALALFLAILLVAGWRSARLYGRQDDFVVRDHFRDSFLSAPPNAALILDGDTQVFAALSTHFVERLRTDLLPIDRTESFLASVYGPPEAHPKEGGIPLERYLSGKEAQFSAGYDWPVLAFHVPEWAAGTGDWRPYGRGYLLKGGANDNLFPSPDGPVRVGRAAATAYDIKTKAILGQVSYRKIGALLDADETRELGQAGIRQIEAIAWEEAGFHVFYGKWLMDRGMFENAERYLRHSLAIYPGSLDGKKQLGILLARTNRYDEAVPLLSDPRLAESEEVRFYLARSKGNGRR